MNFALRSVSCFSRTHKLAASLCREFFTAAPSLSQSLMHELPGLPIKLLSLQCIPSRIGFVLRHRNIHASVSSLGFRASDISCAQYAVDVFEDEKLPGKKAAALESEGLEISKLKISHEIISALARKGIVKLFPIQRAVLEPAMQGRDMIARAKTGTGKTLAFGIPIIDNIIRFNEKHGRGRNPLALVMAPTRELARQVEKEFTESGPNLDTICVYGGVPISSQMNKLDYGVDVVVGTPGRIIDLLKRGALNLSEVQFVVLDEADQMLNVGFEEAVEVIMDRLPKNRQSMMFSATMPNWIRKLTEKYLKSPLIIDLVGEDDQKLAEGITLYSVPSDMYGKPSILGPLITEHGKGGKCIVFTQTKRDADRLAYAMGRSYRCEALHGDISQNQRERTLAGFRDGRFNILIATDVAARGLDIPNVDLVVHYELPTTSEIFVHRSGRTGRAGKKGIAILIYTDDQMRAVRVIERDIGCKFKELPRITVEGSSQDMFPDMGGRSRGGDWNGGRFSSSMRLGGSGKSGGYGNWEFSRSGSFGRYDSFGSGQSSRAGSEFGRSGSSSSGSYGGRFGSSRGGSTEYGRPSGLGGSSGFGRSGEFGSRPGSERSGSNFGNSRSNQSGGSGSSFGFGSSVPSGSGSSRFGSFGSDKKDDWREFLRKPNFDGGK